MDDVLAAGTKLNWSTEEICIEDVEKHYSYPQIVKLTQETSMKYNLPEMESVMLVGRRKMTRLIAQTVEEGHYVMGKQVEIPNEYSGFFKISNDFERDETPLQTFRSMQEVADTFPPKVYLQEQLTVTVPSSDDSNGKFTTIVLQKGDELTIVKKMESQSGAVISNPASRFISKVRTRSQYCFLVVHNTRLNESLSLPLSIQGWFATRPPLLVSLIESRGVISLQQIMEKANFPMTVIVASNSTRSVKDEFVLRSGMHLKLIGLEEHDIVLAIAPFHKIIELSSTGVTVFLPCALTTMIENEKERNQYQTYVQSAFMTSQLQNGPSNVDEYCTSVRFHIPRNKRSTEPKPLNSNASLRSVCLSPTHQAKRMNHGLSAIHLLTTRHGDITMQRSARASNARSTSMRRSLPTPDVAPLITAGNPPLPPRNSPNLSQMSASNFFTSPTPYQSGSNTVPPVPPKHKNPQNAPPLPTLPYSRRPVPSPPPLSDLPTLPNDMPRRPAPVPGDSNALEDLNLQSAQDDTAQDSIDDEGAEEDIWEEFGLPRVESEVASNDEAETTPALATRRKGPVTKTYEDVTPRFASLFQVVTDDSARSDSPCFTLEKSDEKSSQSYENVGLEVGNPDHDVYVNVEKGGYDSGDGEQVPTILVSDPGSRDESVEMSEIHDSDTNSITPINGLIFDDASSKSFISEDGSDASSYRQSNKAKVYMPSPEDWHPPDNIDNLTVEEVVTSLRYIGLSEDVVTIFYNERIDGAMLLLLTDEILMEDFNLSKLYRLKLARFKFGWRPRLSNT